MAKKYTDKNRPKGYYMVNGKRRYWTGSNWRVAPRVRDVLSAPKTDPKVVEAAKQDLKTAGRAALSIARPLAQRVAEGLRNPLPKPPSIGRAISNAQSGSTKPKPKPESTKSGTPYGPGGSPSGSGEGQAQQRKPPSGGGGESSGSSKPKPTSTTKRVGPVNTMADKPNIKSTRAQLKIDKAMRPARKAYLQSLADKEKKKSLEQAKKNRNKRNTTARGPRDRY